MHGSGSQVTPLRPACLHLTFSHTGYVLGHLLDRKRWGLNFAEWHVSDAAAIEHTLARWASTSFTKSTESPYSQAKTTHNFRFGLHLELSDQPNQRTAPWLETVNIASGWQALQAEFVQIFHKSNASQPSSAANAFAGRAAQQISRVFDTAQSLCSHTLAGGGYKTKLAKYLDTTMSKVAPSDQNYYHQWQRTIGSELESKAYLRLAQDREVRRLYKELQTRGQQLYGWSQMLSKLGLSSSFQNRM